MRYIEGNFQGIYDQLWWYLLEEADEVNTGHWQAIKGTPHSNTRELFRVCIETPIPQSRTAAQLYVEPNLPWAEDHFQERVSGIPSNPGLQYANWPWYDPNWKAQKEADSPIPGEEKVKLFSHTYQERMWPQKAGWNPETEGQFNNLGVRYRYGDLQDIVNLLAREPTTRQAYLPIWFPEDTGAHHKERVPCTLGYHFILRGGLLHVTYHIRSCDFLRYFRDDVYMAMRLGQWMLQELQAGGDEVDHPLSDWDEVQMGLLQMNITSLHIFEGDMSKMRREAPAKP